MKEIKLNKLNEKIYYDECNNGLQIFMWTNEKVNNYYATLNVKYGSIDTNFKIDNKEYKVNDGIAHYFEHINFNEKDGKTADQFFDLKGTSVNAFTTYDFTSYNIFGNIDIIENVTYLLDFVQTKVITNDLVEKERNIILEEVRMNKNQPNRVMYYESNKAIYNKNNIRNEIAGTEDDVKKISKKELELVFDNFYQPNNMFLVVTGNFNPYELAAAIKENQKSKKSNKANIKKIYEKEDTKVLKEKINLKGNIKIPKLNISYKISRKLFKDYSDLLLRVYLRTIMNANFGPTSDLKEELMEKNLINTLNTKVRVDKDCVVISILSETKYPEELISIIKQSMKKMEITNDKLRRKIKCTLAYLITSFDDVEYVNNSIIDDIITYNKINNNIFNIIKSLSLEDAKKIINKIDVSNEVTILMEP